GGSHRGDGVELPQRPIVQALRNLQWGVFLGAQIILAPIPEHAIVREHAATAQHRDQYHYGKPLHCTHLTSVPRVAAASGDGLDCATSPASPVMIPAAANACNIWGRNSVDKGVNGRRIPPSIQPM